MYTLGIDLGGTNIVAGVVDENYKVIAKGKVKTNCPRPAEEIADDMAKACFMACENAGISIKDVKACGVGSPGAINPITGIIATANNLGFKDVPLAKMLKERTGVDFYLENDANAAAYGEFLAGGGRGVDNCIAVTLGTGVGGGIIIDGKLFSGSNYAGGELGHTVIVVDGEPCSCGRKGCWESYASATALIRQTKAAMEKDKDSIMWELADHNIDNVNGRIAFDGMRKGDKTACEVVETYEKYVAIGLANIINIFQPEKICIGGGISNEKETLVAPIREFVSKEIYTTMGKPCEILPAELGNDAGIIGAAALYKLYE
ncbi:MAG: ROK family glucokinase [Acutalibacteraceae bacterium]|nr:ROK family glucokinase [Acutalibacteraceae bacterium]